MRGEPLITEAQFGIVGTGDEIITGAGLIVVVRQISTLPITQMTNKTMLTSKNGGRMLSGLDITDTVRGGDVRLETIFDSDDFKHYDTRIDIKDFAVVERRARSKRYRF